MRNEAVKLSKLKFEDFGLDVNKNILELPKCEKCDEYAIMKYTNEQELEHGICRFVCLSGKYPCGVVALKRDNTILIGYSDEENPSIYCRYNSYGFKEEPEEQKRFEIGALMTEEYNLKHYGIIVELEDDFYQAIMD